MNLHELDAGQSVSGDPIKAYSSEESHEQYLYLIAGVHGDEVEGVYVLQELKKWIEENEDISIPMIVVPILNIDGYRASTRTNARGVDLNRNLPSTNWTAEVSAAKYHPGAAPLSEPENKFLVELFEEYPPGLIMSFHSWKPILNINGDCRDVAEFIHQFNQYPVEEDIGYPTPGSLGHYGPEKFSCSVLTYECPLLEDRPGLKEIWQENRDGLLQFLTSDLLKKKLGLPISNEVMI